MNKISIPLSNGFKLIAEQNTGEFDKELFIGLETPEGVYHQDLAIIRPTYSFKDDNVVFGCDRFELLLFGDATREDYTDKMIVPLSKDEF